MWRSFEIDPFMSAVPPFAATRVEIQTWLWELVSDPLFHVASAVVGVAGFIFAIVTHFASRRFKRLTVSRKSFSLVDSERKPVSRLKILFDDVAIENYTVTRFILWNSGKEPIRNADFPENDPLTLRACNGLHILEATVLQVRTESCNCRLAEIDPSTFAVTFDYLDPGDGLVIQVSHHGASSINLIVTGRIIGAGPVETKFRFRHVNLTLQFGAAKVKLGRNWLALVFVLTPIIVAALAAMPETELDRKAKGFAGFGGTSIALALIYWPLAYAIWNNRPPDGLESFDDDALNTRQKEST